MSQELTFRPYTKADQRACLTIFDANCPEYFAPNERADYLAFLDTCPVGYELCEVTGKVMGAFGVFDRGEKAKDLNWILLDPSSQGRGIGSAIMTRVSSLALAADRHLVHIAASHKSAPFFAKFGAEVISVTDHGWGSGMHRHDMELHL
ncbi:MAG: GNAT family N-acetyltransferase [Halioglobus sp.]